MSKPRTVTAREFTQPVCGDVFGQKNRRRFVGECEAAS